VAQGVAEGAALWAAELGPAPTEGCFYPPTLFTKRRAGLDHRASRDPSGRLLVSMTFRHAGRGRCSLPKQHALRARRQASGPRNRQPGARRLRRSSNAAWFWVNSTQPVRPPPAGFGGYRRERLRPRGRARGLPRLPPPALRAAVCRPGPAEPPPFAGPCPAGRKEGPAADRPHGQASISTAKASASRWRLQRNRWFGPDGRLGRRDRARQPQRISATARRGGAQGRRLEPRHPAHNRGADPLLSSARTSRRRAAEFPANRLRAMTGCRKAARLTGRGRGPRSGACFSYGAWADKFEGRGCTSRRCAGNRPSPCPEPIGIIGVVWPDTVAAAGLSSGLVAAGPSHMGNRVVAVPERSVTGLGRHRFLPGARQPPTCQPAVVNIVTGPRDELARVLGRFIAEGRRAVVSRPRAEGLPHGRGRLRARQPQAHLRQSRQGRATWLDPRPGARAASSCANATQVKKHLGALWRVRPQLLEIRPSSAAVGKALDVPAFA